MKTVYLIWKSRSNLLLMLNVATISFLNNKLPIFDNNCKIDKRFFYISYSMLTLPDDTKNRNEFFVQT